jgi:hypothetical protein
MHFIIPFLTGGTFASGVDLPPGRRGEQGIFMLVHRLTP